MLLWIAIGSGICGPYYFKRNYNKVAAMKRWPTPAILKELRGFLRLTGNYKRFIKGYKAFSKTLIDLLKKDNFH